MGLLGPVGLRHAIGTLHKSKGLSGRKYLAPDLRANLSDESIRALLVVRMNVDRLYDIPVMPRQKRVREGDI